VAIEIVPVVLVVVLQAIGLVEAVLLQRVRLIEPVLLQRLRIPLKLGMTGLECVCMTGEIPAGMDAAEAATAKARIAAAVESAASCILALKITAGSRICEEEAARGDNERSTAGL
jgi:hypothetical protein